MSSPVVSLIRAALPKANKYNVLTFLGNPLYDYLFANVVDKVYYWTEQYNKKSWDNTILGQPCNTLILKEQLPIDAEIDAVVVNDRVEQYIIGTSVSQFLHVPLIVVNHGCPHHLVQHPQWNTIFHNTGDMTVFVSEGIRDSWKSMGYLIRYGVDASLFKPNPHKEYDLVFFPTKNPTKRNTFNHIVQGFSYHTIQHCNRPEDLALQISKGKFFVNLDGPSFPPAILFAMSCGVPVLSVDYPELDGVIINYQNGFQSKVNHIPEIARKVLREIPKHDKLCQQTRSFIERSYSLEQYRDSWTNLLEQTTSIIHVR